MAHRIGAYVVFIPYTYLGIGINRILQSLRICSMYSVQPQKIGFTGFTVVTCAVGEQEVCPDNKRITTDIIYTLHQQLQEKTEIPE